MTIPQHIHLTMKNGKWHHSLSVTLHGQGKRLYKWVFSQSNLQHLILWKDIYWDYLTDHRGVIRELVISEPRGYITWSHAGLVYYTPRGNDQWLSPTECSDLYEKGYISQGNWLTLYKDQVPLSQTYLPHVKQSRSDSGSQTQAGWPNDDQGEKSSKS